MSEQIDADKIAENAAKPQSASGDGESVTQFSISEQIAAEKFRSSQAAATNGAIGVRFMILRPPGTAE